MCPTTEREHIPSPPEFTFTLSDVRLKIVYNGSLACVHVYSHAMALASPVWKNFLFPPRSTDVDIAETTPENRSKEDLEEEGDGREQVHREEGKVYSRHHSTSSSTYQASDHLQQVMMLVGLMLREECNLGLTTFECGVDWFLRRTKTADFPEFPDGWPVAAHIMALWQLIEPVQLRSSVFTVGDLIGVRFEVISSLDCGAHGIVGHEIAATLHKVYPRWSLKKYHRHPLEALDDLLDIIEKEMNKTVCPSAGSKARATTERSPIEWENWKWVTRKTSKRLWALK
ncbi:hypothetical protein BDZ45DRAFT_722426 [Acephala macrosclerotiorum]|nr:hypothetical protein BDZ45DRAFT_722426 [Acephala macrosclerotiorum]